MIAVPAAVLLWGFEDRKKNWNCRLMDTWTLTLGPKDGSGIRMWYLFWNVRILSWDWWRESESEQVLEKEPHHFEWEGWEWTGFFRVHCLITEACLYWQWPKVWWAKQTRKQVRAKSWLSPLTPWKWSCLRSALPLDLPSNESVHSRFGLY